MGNVASVSSVESSILILCSLEWSRTQIVMQYVQWFHDGLIFFFHYLLVLERTLEWALSPPHIRFFFALYLEWSLNLSTGKESNAICIFANLRSTLFSLWFKFSSAGFYFLSKFTKKREKGNRENLNVDRQFFKDVIRIFGFNLIAGGGGNTSDSQKLQPISPISTY